MVSGTFEHFAIFKSRFKKLIVAKPELMRIALSNIFTMRLIGNKTHGDLAEIAISEFINQYMPGYTATHVGKTLFRAKQNEEDISMLCEESGACFPVSLKAYGDGPLQLSTDKNFKIYPYLESLQNIHTEDIARILTAPEFDDFYKVNILPLIYQEKQKKCNILVFNHQKAIAEVAKVDKHSEGSGRKHPVYRFYNSQDEYIFEVRYGGRDANALQRGIWTHTRNAGQYFDSLTHGWVDYQENLTLVNLFGKALVSSEKGHTEAVSIITQDIESLRKMHK